MSISRANIGRESGDQRLTKLNPITVILEPNGGLRIFLPTYASWLNWIEPEFTVLRYFALGGTDHHTHAWQREMIDKYICWRNTRAQPKTSFARTQSSARLQDQHCLTRHWQARGEPTAEPTAPDIGLHQAAVSVCKRS